MKMAESVGKGENAGYQHCILFPQYFTPKGILSILYIPFLFIYRRTEKHAEREREREREREFPNFQPVLLFQLCLREVKRMIRNTIFMKFTFP